MKRELTIALSLLSALLASGQSMKENFDFDWQFVYAGSKGNVYHLIPSRRHKRLS